MVTSMSFMHLRSLVGLAKQCRKKMVNLRRLLIRLPEISKNLEKAEKEGDINNTEDGLLKMLNLFSNEEEDRKVIEKDEFKIEVEDIKNEFLDEKKIVSMIESLKSKGGTYQELGNLLESEKREFDEIIRYSKDSVKNLVREELDMLRNRDTRMRYKKIMGDKFQAGRGFQEIITEIRNLKDDKKSHDNVLDLFNHVEIALQKQKGSEDLENSLKDLIRKLKDEGKIRKELFTEIANSLHFLHLIYSQLLDEMNDENPEGFLQNHLKKLEKEGFPDSEKFRKAKAEYENLKQEFDKDKLEIFKMARWIGYETQAGVEQTE